MVIIDDCFSFIDEEIRVVVKFLENKGIYVIVVGIGIVLDFG